MPTITPNLGLKKPLGNENVTRQAYNENLDLLDQNAAKKMDIDAHVADGATETQKGHIELATEAETTAGTDNTRAVHPAGLKVELDKKLAKSGGIVSGTITFTKELCASNVLLDLEQGYHI